MADRYDNHDERICYYELLLENNITEVPQFELPKGYRFVSYTDNDRDENNKITERKVKSLKEHQLSIFDFERVAHLNYKILKQVYYNYLY